MKAYKSKKICNEISEEYGMDLNLINDTIDFFYQNVRKELSECKSLRLSIDELGTFEIKENSIKTYKKKYKSFIENLDLDNCSYREYTIYKSVSKNFKLIDELLLELENENKRKEQIKNKRDEFIKDLEK